jgi:hypothetical protein
MSKSTTLLAEILGVLTRHARERGLSHAEWSGRAGVRKETLSRLRGRDTCDLETLRLLAEVVNVRIGVFEAPSVETTADGHFPKEVDREYEERLVNLCVSKDLSASRWLGAGPRFFVAGLAVMLASVAGHDRRALLKLSEELHPGASEPAVFARWLERSPVRPSRFLPLVAAHARHAA